MVHVGFAEPFCPRGRPVVVAAARQAGLAVADGGTLVVVNGPRFSSRAESQWHQQAGWSVVGMTGMPEAAIARELALCFTTVALVTDLDAGVEGESGVTHEEVLQVFAQNIEGLKAVLTDAVARHCRRPSPTRRPPVGAGVPWTGSPCRSRCRHEGRGDGGQAGGIASAAASAPAAGATAGDQRDPPWGRTRWGRPRWGPVSRRRRWRRSQAVQLVAVALVAVAGWVTVSALLPAPGRSRSGDGRGGPRRGARVDADGGRRARRTAAGRRATGRRSRRRECGVGQVVSGPVLAGEIVTSARFRGATQLAGLAPGFVAVSLPVADGVLLGALRPADIVSVLAAGTGQPLAAAAEC